MPAMGTGLSGRKRFLSDEPVQLMVDPLGFSRRVALFLVQHCVLLRSRWRRSFMRGGISVSRRGGESRSDKSGTCHLDCELTSTPLIINSLRHPESRENDV